MSIFVSSGMLYSKFCSGSSPVSSDAADFFFFFFFFDDEGRDQEKWRLRFDKNGLAQVHQIHSTGSR
jgi:hypothetical protein